MINQKLGGKIEAASLAVTDVDYNSVSGYIAVLGCDQAMVGVDKDPTLNVPDCNTTASGQLANTFLYILEAKSGQIIATLPPTGSKTNVGALQFSHDGKVLAYGLTAGPIVVWDIAAGGIESEIPQPPPGADWWPHVAAFSPDDRFIAVNYGVSTKIWDRANKTFIATIDVPQWPVPKYSADGKTLLLESPPLVTYSTDTWKKLSSLWDGGYPYWAVEDVSPDLTLVANAEINLNGELKNGPVRVYDLKTGKLLQTLDGTWNSARQIQFTPDGRYLLRIDDTGRGLAVWQVDGWKFSDESSVLADKISPTDRFLQGILLSSDGRSIFLWTYARLALYGLPQK